MFGAWKYKRWLAFITIVSGICCVSLVYKDKARGRVIYCSTDIFPCNDIKGTMAGSTETHSNPIIQSLESAPQTRQAADNHKWHMHMKTSRGETDVRKKETPYREEENNFNETRAIYSSAGENNTTLGSSETIIHKANFDGDGFLDKITPARKYVQKHYDMIASSNPVLLVTYTRSGSSWLGDITKQAKDSVYFYEPFQFLIHQAYYTNGLLCYYNNTCRGPKSTVENHRFVIDTVLKLFSCDIEHLHPFVFRHTMRKARQENLCSLWQSKRSGIMQKRTARDIRTNRHVFLPKSGLMTRQCSIYLVEECKRAQFRIIKTVRLSMDLVQTLVGLVQGLKVIHLVRDPRGITNSRAHSAFSKMVRSTALHSISLCNQMHTDIKIGETLAKKNPGKFTTVTYESLAERPVAGAEHIYEFLNAKFDKETKEWIYLSTHAERNSGFFGTQRKDSKETAWHWRTDLSFNKTIIIQKYCKDVFDLLGYIPFNTEEQQKNFTLPSRHGWLDKQDILR